MLHTPTKPGAWQRKAAKTLRSCQHIPVLSSWQLLRLIWANSGYHGNREAHWLSISSIRVVTNQQTPPGKSCHRHACMYVCMHVCTFVRMYVRTYECMYVRLHVRMNVCMYVCMYEVLEKANTISIEVHIHRHRFVGWVTLYCMENYLLAPALCISQRSISKTLPRTHRHCAKLTIPTGN